MTTGTGPQRRRGRRQTGLGGRMDGFRRGGVADCASWGRTRTTELKVTGGRWFLSVCYRKAISPYAHLVSGGKATVARMFVNMSTGQRGLVS